MAGWGNFFGKIFNWIPGREEHIRNKIDKLQRQIDEIGKSKPFTGHDARDIERLTEQLRRLRAKLQNR